MPELPEVETARAVIARAALHRPIIGVDDSDSYVCRPHRPGEIAAALIGRSLTAAHRRGKTMWCETSATSAAVRADTGASAGPRLGLHLGMGGVIIVTDPAGHPQHGGDPLPRNASDGGSGSVWNRFTLTFADGGALVLFDKRRLARARLEPDLDAVGPDAQHLGPARFARLVGGSTAPIKARLLDQSVLAGVGNLLADQTLWQARINPATRVDQLGRTELNRLQRALHRTIAAAIADGGSHTGAMIAARKQGARCPRCGAPMQHGTVGGRSTWWCPAEQ